mmetsp:Transcript_41684/g.99936  ORF Transcript_41684/g.99936 Transcript_41684/m.99936 type:complete len:83 (-) Transcript_41684:49-297(-)
MSSCSHMAHRKLIFLSWLTTLWLMMLFCVCTELYFLRNDFCSTHLFRFSVSAVSDAPWQTESPGIDVGFPDPSIGTVPLSSP